MLHLDGPRVALFTGACIGLTETYTCLCIKSKPMHTPVNKFPVPVDHGGCFCCCYCRFLLINCTALHYKVAQSGKVRLVYTDNRYRHSAKCTALCLVRGTESVPPGRVFAVLNWWDTYRPQKKPYPFALEVGAFTIRYGNVP
jgi:hypothetical protein